MLDFGWSQMVLIAVIALIVLGPKELPKVIKTITELAGKARILAREFKSSVDDMVRESDLKTVKEDLEKAAYKAESEVNKQVSDLGLDSHTIIDGSALPAELGAGRLCARVAARRRAAGMGAALAGLARLERA